MHVLISAPQNVEECPTNAQLYTSVHTRNMCTFPVPLYLCGLKHENETLNSFQAVCYSLGDGTHQDLDKAFGSAQKIDLHIPARTNIVMKPSGQTTFSHLPHTFAPKLPMYHPSIYHIFSHLYHATPTFNIHKHQTSTAFRSFLLHVHSPTATTYFHRKRQSPRQPVIASAFLIIALYS